MTRKNKYWQNGQKVAFCEINPTLCQNVMIIHQTIDSSMKSRYSLIISEAQIDEKHQNSPQIVGMKHGQNGPDECFIKRTKLKLILF